jgi:ribonuclease P protein component
MPARSITSHRDFREVCNEGHVSRTNELVIYVRRRADDGPSRLGLSARWRGATAVERTRAKRRLRAAARETLPDSGWDVVVRVARGCNAKSFQSLRSALSQALGQAALVARRP